MTIYELTYLFINITLIIFLILLNITIICFFIIYLLYWFFPLFFSKISDYLNRVREVEING